MNLEALACGTPVVAYDTGGSGETFDHLTGRLVEKGNLTNLVQATLEVLGSPADSYTERCRERAENRYDIAKQNAAYTALYESLIDPT